MTSLVKKRSVVYGGRNTSVSLEDDFWEAINDIARIRHVRVSDLVDVIAGPNRRPNLSSALRVFVLEYYRSASGKTHWANK